MTPLALLKKRYLSHTNRVRYRPGLQGQRVDENGIVFVGNRAGPTRSLVFLAHELGHFVEVEDHRMTSYNWGLTMPTIVICGTVCNEPNTRAMTERELRVTAYQMNLLESLGAPTKAPRLVSALRFMSDFIHVPLEDGRPAFGDGSPTGAEVNYREKDESRVRWLVKRVTELRAEYTIERFDREWSRKIALLALNSSGSPPLPGS